MHYTHTLYTHNTHTNRAAYTHGSLNDYTISMLLNSGASCSVIAKPDVYTQIKPLHTVRLINADGRDIMPAGAAVMKIGLGKFSTKHQFVVVDHLSTPIILGCDFLMSHGYVLDFQKCTFYRSQYPDEILQLRPELIDPSHTIPQPLHIITVDDECPCTLQTDKHTNTRHAYHCPQTHPSSHLNWVARTPHSMLLTQAMLCLLKFHPNLSHSTTLSEFTSYSRRWPRKALYNQVPVCPCCICAQALWRNLNLCRLNGVTRKDSYPVPCPLAVPHGATINRENHILSWARLWTLGVY